MEIKASVFLEADCYPENEVTVTITGWFHEGERGSRDAYGAQIEPDIDDTIELYKDVYIEELKRDVSIEEAAELFDMSIRDLEYYFIEALWAALESEYTKLPF